MAPATPQGASDAERHISAEIAALHDETYGAGACGLDTHLVDDMVVCVIVLPLQAIEATLLAGSAPGDGVRDRRRLVQECLAAQMVAVVEHTIGRQVVGFFTDAQLEPPLTIDVFRLAPAA
jgi:uncharacterized protein YbcI